MTSHPSARAVIEDTESGLARFQQSGPKGDLQPLSFASAPEGDQLQFMAQNRLVWIRPVPFYWVDSEAGSASHTLFPVAFFKTRDGRWCVADVLIN